MPAHSTAASGSAPTSSHFSNGTPDVTQFRVTTFAHCAGRSPGKREHQMNIKRGLAAGSILPECQWCDCQVGVAWL
jgi:hypothetical protein